MDELGSTDDFRSSDVSASQRTTDTAHPLFGAPMAPPTQPNKPAAETAAWTPHIAEFTNFQRKGATAPNH